VRQPREADPQAKLFLVDFVNFEPMGAQSDAIYDLLKKFKIRGVPVDGIGLGLPMLLDRLPGDERIQCRELVIDCVSVPSATGLDVDIA
jgi:endo-1,4-beta-xylanase